MIAYALACIVTCACFSDPRDEIACLRDRLSKYEPIKSCVDYECPACGRQFTATQAKKLVYCDYDGIRIKADRVACAGRAQAKEADGE